MLKAANWHSSLIPFGAFGIYLVTLMIITDLQNNKKYVDLLKNTKDPMGPTAIAKALGKTVGSVKDILAKLVAIGEIYKVGRGQYVVIDSTDLPDFETTERSKVSKVSIRKEDRQPITSSRSYTRRDDTPVID